MRLARALLVWGAVLLLLTGCGTPTRQDVRAVAVPTRTKPTDTNDSSPPNPASSPVGSVDPDPSLRLVKTFFQWFPSPQYTVRSMGPWNPAGSGHDELIVEFQKGDAPTTYLALFTNDGRLIRLQEFDTPGLLVEYRILRYDSETHLAVIDKWGNSRWGLTIWRFDGHAPEAIFESGADSLPQFLDDAGVEIRVVRGAVPDVTPSVVRWDAILGKYLVENVPAQTGQAK